METYLLVWMDEDRREGGPKLVTNHLDYNQSIFNETFNDDDMVLSFVGISEDGAGWNEDRVINVFILVVALQKWKGPGFLNRT